jgi:hypothetical protein
MSVMPSLLENGLKRMAFIMPESIFTEFAIKKFTEESKPELVNYFDSFESAKSWLLGN